MTAKHTNRMTAAQYRAALDKLGLTPYSAASVLGVSLRQSHRYASGEQSVKPTLALLLAMYLKHGIPPQDQSSAKRVSRH